MANLVILHPHLMDLSEAWEASEQAWQMPRELPEGKTSLADEFDQMYENPMVDHLQPHPIMGASQEFWDRLQALWVQRIELQMKVPFGEYEDYVHLAQKDPRTGMSMRQAMSMVDDLIEIVHNWMTQNGMDPGFPLIPLETYEKPKN